MDSGGNGNIVGARMIADRRGREQREGDRPTQWLRPRCQSARNTSMALALDALRAGSKPAQTLAAMSPAATARNTVLSGGDTSNSIGSRNPARPAATANPITTPRAARTIASRTTIPTRLLRLAVAAHRVLPETLRGHRSKKSPLKRSGEREPKRLWGQHMWRGPGVDRECPPRHHPGSGNREKEVS